MKNLILCILLFTGSILTAQSTFTVSGTTYYIVSGELLTIANAYAQGHDAGRQNALVRGCLDTSVFIGLRPDGRGNEVKLGTYVHNATNAAEVQSITWTIRRWNGWVVDVSHLASDEGDLNFGYRASNLPAQLGGGRLDPGSDDTVQEGDQIIVVYTDDCGRYTYTYTVPAADAAIRYGSGSRPPKIRRPIDV